MNAEDRRFCVLALLGWARNVESESMRLSLLDRAERVAAELGVDLVEASQVIEASWSE